MMSWLRRRHREQFTGWIAGFGTASGHRVVIGHWPRSPYGVVTDVMVEDPAGHRTLYTPTRQLAEFLTATYRFDQVHVVTCNARRSGPRWTVQAGPLQLSFTIGRRTLLGWLLWAMPDALARKPWWVSLLDLPARRLLSGVRTRSHTRDGRGQWYGAHDLHPSSPPTPHSTAANWARSEQSTHRSASASARCRADPPWSTSPPRSRLSTLEMATPLESCPPRATCGGSCSSRPGQRRSASRFKAAPPAWGESAVSWSGPAGPPSPDRVSGAVRAGRSRTAMSSTAPAAARRSPG